MRACDVPVVLLAQLAPNEAVKRRKVAEIGRVSPHQLLSKPHRRDASSLCSHGQEVWLAQVFRLVLLQAVAGRVLDLSKIYLTRRPSNKSHELCLSSRHLCLRSPSSCSCSPADGLQFSCVTGTLHAVGPDLVLGYQIQHFTGTTGPEFHV